jgi:hypothetical protein
MGLRASIVSMRSSYVLGLLAIASGLVTSRALAQAWSDNAAPPIEVPTTPVPQTPPPPAPTPAKPPPPKPAPPPPPAPKASPPPPPAPKGEGEESTTPKYNNEGVFKISGSKGSGSSGKTVKGKATPTVKAKAQNATIAQWPGFRLTDDGGSELMIEFSRSPTSPSEHRAKGSITYIFKGAHVAKSNNKNPLITVHFNTPVMSARLTTKKGDLQLVVDLRPGANVAPSSGLRASSDGDGQQFFVKFPSGAWLPPGAENAEIGPPPTQKLKGEGAKPSDDAAPAPKTESGGKACPAP